MPKLREYFSWADINKIKSEYDINKLKADPFSALFKIGGAYSAISGVMGLTDQYLFGGAGEDFVKENIYDYGTGKWVPRKWDEKNKKYIAPHYEEGEARKEGFLARQYQTLRKYATRPFSAGAEFARYINTENYTYEDYKNKVFGNEGSDLAGPRRENEGKQEYYMRQLLAIEEQKKRLANKPKKSSKAKHKDFAAHGRTPTNVGMYTAGSTAAAKMPGGYRDGGIGQGLVSGYGSPKRLEKIASQYAGGVRTLGQTLKLGDTKIKVSRSA